MAAQKFKTLIVGVDFSTYSKLVFKQALFLQKKWKSRLVVVHATTGLSFVGEEAGHRDVSKPYLQDLGNRIRKVYAANENKMTQYVVKFGDPAKTITKFAKNSPSPLIIVGHRGQTALSRFVLGSTAERVALYAHCPVWVHRGEKIIDPKNLLIPHDFSKTAQDTVKKALLLSSGQSGRSEILNVVPQAVPVLDIGIWSELQGEIEKVYARDMAKLKKTNPRIKIRTVHGEPSQEIVNRARGFDVVLMAPHGRTSKNKYYGNVTGKVIRASPVPILVIH